MDKDKRSELEEILIEAIDKTRLSIFKRRLAQDKGSRDKKMIKKVQELGKELNGSGLNTSIENSDGFANIEPTLFKLNEFIQSKVKITDFTSADKQNLVELFVTHQKTLMSIYFSIFPNTVNIDKKYENLNLSQSNVMTADQRRFSSSNADDILGDQRLYDELLDGNLYEHNDSRDMTRDVSSLFENRSISEIGKYPRR